MKEINWRNKSVVIVEHEANAVGPGHVLESYLLKNNIASLLYIGHPNLYIRKGFEKSSRAIVYEKNLPPSHVVALFFRLPEWVCYMKDALVTVLWVFQRKRKYSVYVGLGNLNALCGVFLKKLGKVDTVVYYVIDYIPDRFSNKILNAIYVYAERYAALWSDRTWNLSPRMIEARNARWGIIFPNQFVTPHGLYLHKDSLTPLSRVHTHELIYMGNLNEEQGIQLVIRSVPELVKQYPDMMFTLIGKGNYESQLRSLVKRLHVSDNVRFLGAIPDNRKMEKRLGQASIGIAMYKPEHAFASNTDPGKIKHYLSVGLPILMTNMAQVAEQIDHYCGFVIPYDGNMLIEKVKLIWGHRKLFSEYRMHALSLAKKYIWDDVFKYGFSGLFS